MLIDSHCHLNSLSLIRREEVITSCSASYILINSTIDLQSSKDSTVYSNDNSFIYLSLGFHPFCVAQYKPELLKDYQELIIANKGIVAIGEIGLDYKADAPLDKQEEVFVSFIELAKKVNLPIVIHNRLDGFRVLEVLDSQLSSYEKAIFHCFSYSQEFLERITAKGGFVSFSLNVLRGNKQIVSSLKSCPLENLLFETDSPYMRVEGKPSTPLDIDRVYKFAAKIKELEVKQLEDIVASNANRIFKLKIRR